MTDEHLSRAVDRLQAVVDGASGTDVPPYTVTYQDIRDLLGEVRQLQDELSTFRPGRELGAP